MIMPSSTATASPTTDSPQCPECGKAIARKADFSRHMKLHLPSEERQKLMYRCPYNGCSFENLQKSNLETHVRVHNGEKSKACPDCDFITCDPGSLTRHRKRLHNYTPKARKGSAVGRQPTAKRSSRVSPYTRRGQSIDGYSSSSSSSLPSVSSGSDHPRLSPISCTNSLPSCPTTPPSEGEPPFTVLSADTFNIPSCTDEGISHGWDEFKSTEPIPTLVAARPPTPAVLRSPNPRSHSPALGTITLEEFALSLYWASLYAAHRKLSPSFVVPGYAAQDVEKFNWERVTEPMAHIEPLRSQFENICTYPNIYTPTACQEYVYEHQVPAHLADLCSTDFTVPIDTPPKESWSLQEFLSGVPAEAPPQFPGSWGQLCDAPPLTPDPSMEFLSVQPLLDDYFSTTFPASNLDNECLV